MKPTDDELRGFCEWCGWGITTEVFGHNSPADVLWVSDDYGIELQELGDPTGIGHVIDAMVRNGETPTISIVSNTNRSDLVNVSWFNGAKYRPSLIVPADELIPAILESAINVWKSEVGE